MNWSSGAISIRSGQSGQLRELISAPAAAKPTPPLPGLVRHAYGSCPLQFGGGGPASFQADETARVIRWVDDEDLRVVDGVVLLLSARVREVEPQVQAAVREGWALDRELQRQRPRGVVPAELAGPHLAARDEDRRVVSQLPPQPRRRQRVLGDHVEREGERLTGEELQALVAFRPEQPDALDARSVPAPLLQPRRTLLRIALAGEHRAVRDDRV